jgi:hypothetical protein
VGEEVGDFLLEQCIADVVAFVYPALKGYVELGCDSL